MRPQNSDMGSCQSRGTHLLECGPLADGILPLRHSVRVSVEQGPSSSTGTYGEYPADRSGSRDKHCPIRESLQESASQEGGAGLLLGIANVN